MHPKVLFRCLSYFSKLKFTSKFSIKTIKSLFLKIKSENPTLFSSSDGASLDFTWELEMVVHSSM